MYVQGKTICEAWLSLLDYLVNYPDRKIAPRGLATQEILGVQLEVHDLRANLLVHPDRNLNYRFAVAELLWIAFGLDDLAILTRYNKQMSQFSDDGLRLAGAYGPRLAPQWNYIASILLRDHDTRQAVATIWTPNPTPSRDVPCLAGETVIRSPEGNLSIATLEKRFLNGMKRYPVYTFNSSIRRIELGWCTKVWQSGVKKTHTLIFDDGSRLRLTDDHILYQKIRVKAPGLKPKGSTCFVIETKVKDFKPGDRVWASKFFIKGKKGSPKLHFIENLSNNWRWQNQVQEHRAYDEFLRGPLPKGFDVHHADDNSLNNAETNLLRLSHDTHAALKMVGDKNPMRRETSEKKKLRINHLNNTYATQGKKREPKISMTKEQLSKFRSKKLRDFWADPMRREQRCEALRRSHAMNHVIVAIEESNEVPVFDFTVDRNESAVTESGIPVHNCTISLQWLLRENKLHVIVTMRSSDCWLGLPYDAHVFGQLTNMLAGTLGVETGSLFMQLGSSHLYDVNLEQAQRVLETPGQGYAIEGPLLPGRPNGNNKLGLHSIMQGLANDGYVIDYPWSQFAAALVAGTWTEARLALETEVPDERFARKLSL